MRILQHLLMFKLENYSREDINKFQQQIGKMQRVIPGIIYASFDDAEFDLHPGHKNRTRGFTHSAVVLLKDEKYLGPYANHPEHLKLNSMVKPFIVDKMCIDSFTDNFPSKL